MDLEPAGALSGGTPMPFHTFLWKIASRCNLNCSYCYVYHLADSRWRMQPALMTVETARSIARRMRDHLLAHDKDSASIIFHGGEPLLGGRSHLAQLLDVIGAAFEGSGIDLSLGLQTNLIPFDAEIGELLRERNVTVGVSIDGPPDVNDRHRLDHHGRGSAATVTEKLALLTSPRFRPIFSGFLSVIDPTSDPVKVIDYLSSFHPPSIDFLLPLDTHERLPFGMREPCGPSPHGPWLIKAFDRWLSLTPPQPVRIFDNIIALLCGAPSQVENLGLTPVDLIVVETNGEIEAVDSLKATYEGSTKLGFDVHAHSFDTVAAHAAVVARQAGLNGLCERCRRCEIVGTCGGGYLPHRYSAERGFDNPSVYCATLYALIHHIRQTLVRELAGAREPRPANEDWRFRDNGFSSLGNMLRAHEPIVRLAQGVLGDRDGASVLELGCGNGLLLQEIVSGVRAVPFGIEVDAGKARRADAALRAFGGRALADDLFTSEAIWLGQVFDLAIVSASAFLEGPANLVKQLRARLAQRSRLLLIYAYSDDLERFGTLDQIAGKASLRLVGARVDRTASLADIVS
jgi:uncharacterized protein